MADLPSSFLSILSKTTHVASSNVEDQKDTIYKIPELLMNDGKDYPRTKLCVQWNVQRAFGMVIFI